MFISRRFGGPPSRLSVPSRGLLFGPDELLIVTVVLKSLKTVKASKLADLLVRCKRAVVKVELQVPRVSSETRLGRVSSSTSYGSLRVFNLNLKLKFSR